MLRQVKFRFDDKLACQPIQYCNFDRFFKNIRQALKISRATPLSKHSHYTRLDFSSTLTPMALYQCCLRGVGADSCTPVPRGISHLLCSYASIYLKVRSWRTIRIIQFWAVNLNALCGYKKGRAISDPAKIKAPKSAVIQREDARTLKKPI